MSTHTVLRLHAAFALLVAAALLTSPAYSQESCSNGSPPPCTGDGDDSGIGVGDQIGLTQPPVDLPLPRSGIPSNVSAPSTQFPPVEEGADALTSIMDFVTHFYIPPPEGSARVEVPVLDLESDPPVQDVAGDLGSLSIAM